MHIIEKELVMTPGSFCALAFLHVVLWVRGEADLIQSLLILNKVINLIIINF